MANCPNCRKTKLTRRQTLHCSGCGADFEAGKDRADWMNLFLLLGVLTLVVANQLTSRLEEDARRFDLLAKAASASVK